MLKIQEWYVVNIVIQKVDTIQFASAQTLEELTEFRKTAGLPRFALKTADSRIIYQINSMLKDGALWYGQKSVKP